MVGLPKIIQSDQGTNFTSTLFKQILRELKVDHVTSSAYHPESQRILECFHQTLKNMMRCYCLENSKDWDDGVPLLLFGVREAVQESIGFSPFELVYGHNVRGPLRLCKEQLLSDEPEKQNLLKYVTTLKERLFNACNTAKENLKQSQADMKVWYDKKARLRSFSPGDEVLVLLPVSGNTLQARYQGPYMVKKKVSDVDYVVHTPDRKKKHQLCHINMIKQYNVRQSEKVAMTSVGCETEIENEREADYCEIGMNVKLQNSDVLDNMGEKLCHLTPEKQNDITALLNDYKGLCGDVPGRTTVIQHDVDVGDARPIKQHPYRMSPIRKEKLDAEIKYMMQNEIIEPSLSPWSSPCLLVPKSDGSSRFCTDYRKVNDVTKTDTFPIPRMEDCIDRVGSAKYVTKIDLMKGYWQVPLTPKAVEVSAFVTQDGLYLYRVMPFGMKNSRVTFQRFMKSIIFELEGVDVYTDDLNVSSET